MMKSLYPGLGYKKLKLSSRLRLILLYAPCPRSQSISHIEDGFLYELLMEQEIRKNRDRQK